MNTEAFFNKVMAEDHPRAGRLRLWWERRKFALWLELKPYWIHHRSNREWIKSLPE